MRLLLLRLLALCLRLGLSLGGLRLLRLLRLLLGLLRPGLALLGLGALRLLRLRLRLAGRGLGLGDLEQVLHSRTLVLLRQILKNKGELLILQHLHMVLGRGGVFGQYLGYGL